MPRKSKAAGNVIRLPGQGDRSAPPGGLSAAQNRAWAAVVSSAPGRWLDPAAQLLLRRLVTQISIAERHEQRLTRIADEGDGGEEALEAELTIAKAHRETTKNIIQGMTALRVTPRARMESRNARFAFEKPRGRRPWDIEGEAIKDDDHGEGGEAEGGEGEAQG
jgi:hypothetical protein